MNSEETKREETKQVYVTTGEARICYANVWEPKKDESSGKMKYSCTVLIPKEDKETFEALKSAVISAYENGLDTLKGTAKNAPSLGSIKIPLRDGDEERPEDPIFSGCIFLNATSIYAPDVYDLEKNLIQDHDEVYSGCFCRVALKLFAYNTKGGRGIGAGLVALQKVGDGEPLGSKINTADLF